MPSHNPYDPLATRNSPSPRRDSFPLAHLSEAEDTDPQYDEHVFTPYVQYSNEVDSYQRVPQHDSAPTPVNPPEYLTGAPSNLDDMPVAVSVLPAGALSAQPFYSSLSIQ